jgi:hypothetical protein
MKHLKTYKQNTDEPQIGDYVIAVTYVADLSDFVNNNIGKIIRQRQRKPGLPPIIEGYYKIQYQNIPPDIKSDFFNDNSRLFLKKNIIHFSKNKEDLEIYLDQNKYNI